MAGTKPAAMPIMKITASKHTFGGGLFFRLRREGLRREAVCEASVFLLVDGKENKIMENVTQIHPEADCLLLSDLLGRQRVVRARVKSVDFVQHRVILEEAEAEN